ncbi:hypothetical protein QQF64_017058 [Cirrhinus molitorella]
MNKRSDVSKAVKKSGQVRFPPVNGKRMGSHREGCCRKQPPSPTPKTEKKYRPIYISPPPPVKLPDIKRPSRPKIIWPIAPDGFIPNSVVRSLAPFPPRSGSPPRVRKTEKLEDIKDFLAESIRHIDGLVKK